jgi:hypothetical protein
MISLIGIGDAGCNVVTQFENHKEYNCFLFSEGQENTKYTRKLPKVAKAEDCEEQAPKLSSYKTLSAIQDRVQVFLCGSSFSANYTLAVLQQIRDRQIDIFYIKPDVDLLIGDVRLQERAVFGILQQYARSGLFNSFTILSNPSIEKTIGEIPIKKYFETINKSIYYAVHYLNVFDHTEPLVGNLSKPSEVQKIRSVGVISVDKLSENWYYKLEEDRDVCYYLCIAAKRLETDGKLHSKVVESLKKKPRNAFKNVTYAIYESPYESDFGFCVAHTNFIQGQKLLDSTG